jgi:3',5'-cyclic AMP phosphodiesterase CpdA
MAASSAAEQMEQLQLSDEDTEELWNSPSQRRTKTPDQKTGKEPNPPSDRSQNRDSETLFDREEAREAALRNELQTVKNVNQAIEGVLESLARARGNMEVGSHGVVRNTRQGLTHSHRQCLAPSIPLRHC